MRWFVLDLHALAPVEAGPGAGGTAAQHAQLSHASSDSGTHAEHIPLDQITQVVLTERHGRQGRQGVGATKCVAVGPRFFCRIRARPGKARWFLCRSLTAAYVTVM